MTIEPTWEVNCDSCGSVHVDDSTASKREVLRNLKHDGWKNRKRLMWCRHCVENGHYERGYVEWMDSPVK